MNKVELTVKKEYMTDVMNILGQMTRPCDDRLRFCDVHPI